MPEALKVHVAAGIVIKKDDKYLLVQEAQKVCYGKWTIPAGKVDFGETLEQAAVRETKEETGYDVRILRRLAIFHEIAEAPVKHAYEAEIVSGELYVPKEELLDVQWFTYNQIEAMKDMLRNPWVLEAINLVEKSH